MLRNGWIGPYLAPLGIKVAYTPLGVVIALTFIGLPFVVRTVQPVLEDLDKDMEEAAASLGANRWQMFRQVILPAIPPAALTGFAMAFARGLGEYGSVVFISGNMPMRTEITPLLIITKLEQYDYAGATAIAVVMLVVSFVLLLAINLLAEVEQHGASRGIGRRRRRFPATASKQLRSTGLLGSQVMADQYSQARTLRGFHAVAGRATRESALVRWTLIAVAALFLGSSLFCRWRPFSARPSGRELAAYFGSFRDPDALAAIRLTLIACRRLPCR